MSVDNFAVGNPVCNRCLTPHPIEWDCSIPTLLPREKDKPMSDDLVERVAQLLQDYLEPYGLCLKASEWDQAATALLPMLDKACR